MIMKNVKELQKVSYFCLTLLSIVLPSTAQALESDQPESKSSIWERMCCCLYSAVDSESTNQDLSPTVFNQGDTSTSGGLVQEFLGGTTKLKEREQQEEEIAEVLGEILIEGTARGLKEVADNNFKNPEIRRWSQSGINGVKERILSGWRK